MENPIIFCLFLFFHVTHHSIVITTIFFTFYCSSINFPTSSLNCPGTVAEWTRWFSPKERPLGEGTPYLRLRITPVTTLYEVPKADAVSDYGGSSSSHSEPSGFSCWLPSCCVWPFLVVVFCGCSTWPTALLLWALSLPMSVLIGSLSLCTYIYKGWCNGNNLRVGWLAF